MSSEQFHMQPLRTTNPSYEGVAVSHTAIDLLEPQPSTSYTMAPSSSTTADVGAAARHSRHKPTLSIKSDPGIIDRQHAISCEMPSRKIGYTFPKSGSKYRRNESIKRKKMKSTTVAPARIKPGISREDLLDLMITRQDAVDGSPLESPLHSDLRCLATPMSNKRYVKSNLEERESITKKYAGWVDRQKTNVTESISFLSDTTNNILSPLAFWRTHIKVIEGHFGTGVASYFLFLKWLFLMNMPPLLLQIFLIALPQILYRWKQQIPNGYNNNATFSGWEIITGTGWMSETELYYGYYHHGIIQIDEDDPPYDMRYAYICTVAVYYLLLLFIITFSLMHSYKKNYIETSGALRAYYVNKVLCGWDHNITRPKTAEMKHNSIYIELKEYLASFHTTKSDLSFNKWLRIVLLRLLIHIVVLGLIALSSYLVWYIALTLSLQETSNFANEMTLPISITAINYLLPLVFTLLSKFETYRDPRIELYFTMARCVVLNVSTLGILVFIWYNKVDCDTNKIINLPIEMQDCKTCWETFMGEQLYKLVIVDFIFAILLTLITEFCKRLIATYFPDQSKKAEFNVGRNTLYLIYSQALIWLGVFYSPLLGVAMIIKLFIIFYVKRYSVTNNCIPSVVPWRPGRTHTVIMAILFLAFLISFIATAYGIVFIKPSSSCGPYQGYNSSYHVITDLFEDWTSNDGVKELIEFVTSTGFIYALIIGFCIIVHYARMVSEGWNKTINQLRQQITLEGKDKKFLLNLLNHVAQQNRKMNEQFVDSVCKPDPSVSQDRFPSNYQNVNPAYQDKTPDNTLSPSDLDITIPQHLHQPQHHPSSPPPRPDRPRSTTTPTHRPASIPQPPTPTTEEQPQGHLENINVLYQEKTPEDALEFEGNVNGMQQHGSDMEMRGSNFNLMNETS